MFTDNNTEGYSAAELVVLNDAFAIIAARNPGMDEANICDVINNAWVGGETAEQLANSTGF
jgi:hypothetical protein